MWTVEQWLFKHMLWKLQAHMKYSHQKFMLKFTFRIQLTQSFHKKFQSDIFQSFFNKFTSQSFHSFFRIIKNATHYKTLQFCINSLFVSFENIFNLEKKNSTLFFCKSYKSFQFFMISYNFSPDHKNYYKKLHRNTENLNWFFYFKSF